MMAFWRPRLRLPQVLVATRNLRGGFERASCHHPAELEEHYACAQSSLAAQWYSIGCCVRVRRRAAPSACAAPQKAPSQQAAPNGPLGGVARSLAPARHTGVVVCFCEICCFVNSRAAPGQVKQRVIV